MARMYLYLYTYALSFYMCAQAATSGAGLFQQVKCPTGWYQYSPKGPSYSTDSQSLTCLKYNREPKTYHDAARQCSLLRSQLINVNAFMTDLMTSAAANVTTASVCRDTLSGKGSIWSPGFPQSYPDNVNCQWNISADTGKAIVIQFLNFDTEACCDALNISQAGRATQSFAGTARTFVRKDIMLGNQTTVNFTSDQSIIGQGFYFHFFSVSTVTGCGGTLDSEGSIMSPGYPAVYANSVLCTWTIPPPTNKSVLLQFIAFDLEHNFDYLRVYSMSSYPTAPLLQSELSGQELPRDILLVKNVLQLKFSTDALVQKNGFLLRYFFVSTDCNVALHGSGTFASPGYPKSYPNNVVCQYTLQATDGNALRISFVSFVTEDCCDRVDVYNGSQASAASLVITLHGNSQVADIIVFSSNATLVFTSDSSNQQSGFYANFSSVQATPIGAPQQASFWSSLHKENDKFYWDAVNPILDDVYHSTCTSQFSDSSNYNYGWECGNPTSLDCASGKFVTVNDVNKVAFSSANCSSLLPYFCSMQIGPDDIVSELDTVFASSWQYNSFTDSCYKYFNKSFARNYTEAVKVCADKSGFLATPDSDVDRAIILNIISGATGDQNGLQTFVGIYYSNGSSYLSSKSGVMVSNVTADLSTFATSASNVSCGVATFGDTGGQWKLVNCGASWPFICQQDCSNTGGTMPSLATSTDASVLTCNVSTHDLSTVFWMENGDYMQPPAYGALSLNVPGPLAAYQCGVLENRNGSVNRLWSNIKLAAGPNAASTIFHRVIITMNYTYDSNLTKYTYYKNVASVSPPSLVSFANTQLKLVVFASSSANSVTVDGYRPSALYANATDIYLMATERVLNANVTSNSTDLFPGEVLGVQQALFSAKLMSALAYLTPNASLWPSGALPQTVTVRDPFYCLATVAALKGSLNATAALPRTPAGSWTLSRTSNAIAYCDGNYTVGAFWGEVLQTASTKLPTLRQYNTTLGVDASASTPNGVTTTILVSKTSSTTPTSTIPVSKTSSTTPTFDVTSSLRGLIETGVSVDNVHDVASTLIGLTNSTGQLTPAHIADIATIVSQMASLTSSSSLSKSLLQVPSLVGEIVGNVMNADSDVLSGALNNSGNSSFQASLETSLSALAQAAARNQSAVDSSYLAYMATNLAFQVILNSSIIGLSIDNVSALSVGSVTSVAISDSNTGGSPGTTSFTLASYAANGVKSFLVYNNAKLFQGSSGKLKSPSKVISAQLPALNTSQQIQGLVTIVFAVPKAANGTSHVCGYWNFSTSDWSVAGCRVTNKTDSQVTCVCDHLTNFAALLDSSDQANSLDATNELILTVISYVGLGVSVLALAAVILSFLIFRKLRRTVSQKVLFNLALALISLDIVFVAGVDQTANVAGCMAVAAILHYFLLATFMWMLMESVLQYLRFVKVLGTYIPRFTLKASIAAWGVPAVIVAIICGVDFNLYKGGDQYCWAKPVVVYYGVLMPIGVILVINAIMYGIVLRALCCKKKTKIHSNQSERSLAALHVRAAIAVCIVLGLTWIFGFFSIGDARVSFQYLFCICNSIQGLLIFAFHCIREKALQEEWKKACCRAMAKQQKSSVSLDDTITSSSTSSTRSSQVSLSQSLYFSNVAYGRRGTYDVTSKP